MNATFYSASPYRWEVLGWMSDVSRITKQEMIDYREQYYRPDNATLVLAGDLDPDKVMPLVAKYFGAVKSKGKSPRVRTEEPSPGVSTARSTARTSRRPTSRSASSARPPPTPPSR